MSIKWISVGEQAVGVVAIGQLATGVFAVGQMATGIVAIGQLARGVFVVGQLAYGVVAIGQLGLGLGLAGGMVGAGGRRWFGWIAGLLERHDNPRTVWWVIVYAALVAGFYFVVAVPLWNGLFSLGGAFNQPLR